MLVEVDQALSRAVVAWVDRIRIRPLSVTLTVLALTVALGAYAVENLGLNSDELDLFRDVPYQGAQADFYDAFPVLIQPIVLVIDGETADLAHRAAETLADRIESSGEYFESVYRPGGGAFFEENGLLYLEEEDLGELIDNLYGAQPYLAKLSQDPSLRGFFGMLGLAVDAAARGDLEGVDLPDVLGRVTDAIDAHLAGSSYRLSWAEVISGREASRRERRRFLLANPIVDYAQLNPAGPALTHLRSLVSELGYDGSEGVRVRATGVLPLSYEEMEHIGSQTTLAGAVSLVAVAILLLVGLGSTRLVIASLVTLIAGLVWTAAFAAFAIGHLNLISVAFAVLFIGLSIDFAIHLCVRLREALARGMPMPDALSDAVGRVGASLVICATTTAIGFYAFVPTEFAGVGELGLIAGTGMFVSLFMNLTLLPALIAWGVPAASVRPLRATPLPGIGWLGLPVRHPRWILGATAVLAAGSLWLVPRVQFDPNPLRMRDPSTDSVQVMNEMLADGDAFPWNLNVLARDPGRAKAVAERIESLAEVDYAVTLGSYVPEDQEDKLELLADASYDLLPTLAPEPSRPPATPVERREALDDFEARLDKLEAAGGDPTLIASARRLGASITRLRVSWTDVLGAGPSLAALEAGLVGTLADRLRILRASLQADAVDIDDLPPDLMQYMVGTDGRVRVEVFPAGDLNEVAALESYVDAIREVEPSTFGEGIVILETGRAVVRAMRQALLTAGVAIALLLLLLWRNIGDAALVAVPLALAALFTAAAGVLLSIPFNFANVIVIPLLLGMGVDSGIHLMHRARSETSPDGNLLRTGTARAVLLSAATTIASFGTLGLSSHLGMASLGQLLSLGIALILVCNLGVLPALARVSGRVRQEPAAP